MHNSRQGDSKLVEKVTLVVHTVDHIAVAQNSSVEKEKRKRDIQHAAFGVELAACLRRRWLRLGGS